MHILLNSDPMRAICLLSNQGAIEQKLLYTHEDSKLLHSYTKTSSAFRSVFYAKNKTKRSKQTKKYLSKVFLCLIKMFSFKINKKCWSGSQCLKWFSSKNVIKGCTYKGEERLDGSRRKQRWRKRPAHNWTPMIPKMKNTKKQSKRTLPNMGKVSNKSITNIRIPVEKKRQ